MKLQRALSLLLPFTLLTACIDENEQLADTESELSAFDWSAAFNVTQSFNAAQVATINGTTYMVHTGQYDHNMYWRKRTGPNSWSNATLIPGQTSPGQANLAAFNGYLYMVHVAEYDTYGVYFSRFNPTTETWTPNVKLQISGSIGAPALAAFDGRLWMVGSSGDDGGSRWLWVTTMNTDGAWGPTTTMRKLTSTPVSLAVFANKLYMAYGSGSSIVTMTHAAGTLPTTWSAPSAVKAGPSGSTSQGYNPRIAVAGGYLHLVHRRPGQRATWWTYLNTQCTWTPEVQFDQTMSDDELALANGGPGLVLMRGMRWSAGSWQTSAVNATEYTAPLPPTGLPQCGVTVGT